MQLLFTYYRLHNTLYPPSKGVESDFKPLFIFIHLFNTAATIIWIKRHL